MKEFVKYFFIAFIVQMVLLAFIWVTGLGGVLMYGFYLFPWVVLNEVSPIPKQIAGGKGFVYFVATLAIPAALYALLVGVLVWIVNKIRDRSGSIL